VLSEYFGKPVYLVYKGPQPRVIDATPRYPELKATAKYQDMYPLLVLSEESTVAIEDVLRDHVGTQGIHERWAGDNVAIERCGLMLFFIKELYVLELSLSAFWADKSHYIADSGLISSSRVGDHSLRTTGKRFLSAPKTRL
jgi:hypothetical protein